MHPNGCPGNKWDCVRDTLRYILEPQWKVPGEGGGGGVHGRFPGLPDYYDCKEVLSVWQVWIVWLLFLLLAVLRHKQFLCLVLSIQKKKKKKGMFAQAIMVATIHNYGPAGGCGGHHHDFTGRVPRQLRPGLLLSDGLLLWHQFAGSWFRRLRVLQSSQGNLPRRNLNVYYSILLPLCIRQSPLLSPPHLPSPLVTL